MRSALDKSHLVLGITGASGAPLALRLLEVLLARPDLKLSVIMSPNARKVFEVESNVHCGESKEEIYDYLLSHFRINADLTIHDEADMASAVSSGSHKSGGMIICPCSMNSLAAIANGLTLNLIHRAASVMLKEKRPLYLVPRESPLSPVHLRNMLELSRIGVHIIPATTAFYQKPRSVQDMIDFVCARVLDLAGIPHQLSSRWTGAPACK